MKKFQVLTDSTSDIEKKFRDALEIDYIPMGFTIAGKEYPADLDWTELSPDDYYNLMRNGNRSVTSLISQVELEKKLNQYLKAGLDVLYIACSSKLSGSYNVAKMYYEEIKDQYPNVKFVAFDSLRSNYAEGAMAMKAAKDALDGKSIDTVVAELEETKLCYQTYATVGTLEWLKKAGRIKATKAFFGNLMGVKPIILGDAIGNNYAFKKVKGRGNSINQLLEEVKANVVNPSETTIYIEHADCLEDATKLVKLIEEEVKPKAVNLSNLGPIIGATCGPDTITVNFFGKKVSIVGEE